MKKRIAIIMSVLLTVALCVTGAFIVGADSTEPTLEIKGHALSLSDSIYIKYYVRSSVDGVELIVEGVDDPITYSYTQTIGGEKYYVFDYKGLAAKNMTDDVYAKAHVKVGGKDYYSETDKYSVLQYAYTKLGKIGNSPTSDEKLKTLLEGVLDYGALAQTYLGYNTERLASANWYQINVIGGTLGDDFNSGLYLEGDSVTLTAPEKDADGNSFSHWVNSKGEKVSSTVTIGSTNETYTAVYVNYSAGLTFVINSDGTYSLTGIGSCKDTVIYIPEETSTGGTGKVTAIKSNAFKGNSDITSVMIPEGVTTIGSYAFENCSNLESITLPSSLKSIDSYAFAKCPKLKNVYYNGDVGSWLKTSFPYSYGNPLINGASLYINGKPVTDVIVPDDNTYIPSGAFAGCASLKKIVLHDKVTSIGGDAFRYCSSLESINIPSSVTQIYGYAFTECTSLISIEIPESVTSIGSDSMFYGCTSLETASIGCSYIGSDWFKGCSNLKSVTIGSGVKNVYRNAFADCAKLSDIYYDGTSDEWSNVSIGSGNDQLDSANLHFKETFSFSYTVNTDSTTCTITGYTGNATKLAIPESIDGYTVTAIGKNAFANDMTLTEIILPDTLETIGYSAFSNCVSLESITIPDSVTSIGSSAFEGCTSLDKVYYNGDIESWLKISFGDHRSNPCCNDAELYFGEDLVTEVRIPDTVSVIPDYAFRGCSSITSVFISNSVTELGWSAFWGCANLTNVVLSDNVTTISGSFRDCLRLKSIVIPEGVTSIGSSAFNGCTSLESVTLPSSLKAIGYDAFAYCEKLEAIGLPSGLKSIGDEAFLGCKKLVSVTIPDSVTSIGIYAFRNCTSLKNLTIGNGVKKIDDSTFYWCKSLKKVTIGSGVTSIGQYAFAGCFELTDVIYNGSAAEWSNIVISTGNDNLTSLTVTFKKVPTSTDLECSINVDGKTCTVVGIGNCTDTVLTIPETIDGYTVTVIGDNAFENCTQLTEIDLPSTLEKIGTRAFMGCTGITEITIPESVTEIGTQIFYKATNLTTVYYNSAYYSEANPFLSIMNIKKVVFGGSSVPDNILKGSTNVTEVVIKEDVEKIGGYAFYGCTNLTSISIPSSLTEIYSGAFCDCTNLKTVYYSGDIKSFMNIWLADHNSTPLCNGAALYINGELITEVNISSSMSTTGQIFKGCTSITKVTVSGGISSIDEMAFCGCTNLTTIIIPDTVTSIGSYAFENCTSLESIAIPDSVLSIGEWAFYNCTSLKSITIPDSVTSISRYAFYNCTSLTSVTIPDSLAWIGEGALCNCSVLTDVYYSGTKEQWDAITIGSYNENLTSASIHYIKNIVVNNGVYTVTNDWQWGVCVLGESTNWEVTMTLRNSISNAEYGLQICGKDDNGDGRILEGDDSFLQIYLTGNDVIRLIGCDNGWGNVSGYQWGNIDRYTGLGSKDELTLTIKLDGKKLSYWVDGKQLGEAIVLDDSVIYGNVVTLFMKHTATSISNVTFKDNITVIDATGGEAGEFKMGDVADVTKKYFAVSYTMMASTYAGDPSDNGCCGLFFGSNDDTCIFIPYDGTNDTQRIIGIGDIAQVRFGNWWGQACIFGSTAHAEITPNTEVTILVLGVKDDDGRTTVTAYLNGTQINVWGGGLTATGEFGGHIGWTTRLTGQEATVKFIESDSPISATVFG